MPLPAEEAEEPLPAPREEEPHGLHDPDHGGSGHLLRRAASMDSDRPMKRLRRFQSEPAPQQQERMSQMPHHDRRRVLVSNVLGPGLARRVRPQAQRLQSFQREVEVADIPDLD